MHIDAPGRKKLTCVVITYNRDDFITTCVDSLLRSETDALAVEVTVLNNGATDGTADILQAIDDPRLHVRTNRVNMPLVSALNDCLEVGHAAGADYVLLLNDDIEMRPGAIAEMIEVCDEVPDAIVTPLQVNYRKPDEIDGGMLDLLRKTDPLLNDVILGGPMKRYYTQRTLIGAALLARPDTFAAVGDFDPLFTFYGVDDDYCNRAQAMGIPLLVAIRAHMLHMHGKTSANMKASRKDWMRRWTTQYRARMIFILKSRDRALAANYGRAVLRMLGDMVSLPFKRFPGGSVGAARTLFELVKAFPRVRARRDHEDRLIAAYRARH
jgi:N-acetylglucosaminyl-diphospho-decaprenol L-rhamnosyltransferase